jgi:hypothetical protein
VPAPGVAALVIGIASRAWSNVLQQESSAFLTSMFRLSCVGRDPKPGELRSQLTIAIFRSQESGGLQKEEPDMPNIKISRLTATMGLISSLLVLVLVAMNIITGVSQEYFESSHPVDQYTQSIVRDAGQLALTFTIDNLFILSYAAFFIGLAIVLRPAADSLVLNVALAVMLSVALLDVVENHHITAMAQAAVDGVSLTNQEIRAQVVLSSVKFHLSCFGALLFAVAFPRDRFLGKVICWLLVAYGFFGVLVLTAPPSLVIWLAILRTVFFVVSFLLSAIWLWHGPSSSDGGIKPSGFEARRS